MDGVLGRVPSHAGTQRERIAAALVGLVAVYVFFYLLGPAGSTSFDSWNGFLAAAAELTAIAGCIYAVHRFHGGERLGWVLIGLGVSGGLIGHVYAAATGGHGDSLVAYVSGAIGIASYVAVVGGVGALFAWRLSRDHWPRMIDLSIVCLASLTLIYQQVLRGSVDGVSYASVVAALYLVGSIAFVYLIVASGALHKPRPAVGALAAGALFVAVGNLVYLDEVVNAGPVMSGDEGAYWSLALLLLAVAALTWRAGQQPAGQPATSLRALALPSVAGILVAVEGTVAQLNRTDSFWLGLFLAAMFVLVVVRLALTAQEAARGQRAAELMATQERSLLNAAKAVSSTLEPDQVIHRVVAEFARLLGISEVGFAEIRPDGSAKIRQAYGAARGSEGMVTPEGEGLVGMVVARGESVVCGAAEWRRDGRDRDIVGRLPDFAHLLGVPVRVRGKIRAVLVSGTTNPAQTFTPEQVRIGEALGELAAVALGNADTIAEVRKRAAESQALRLAATNIAAQRDVDEIMSHLARDGRALLGADAGVVAYVDEHGRTKWRHGSGLRVDSWRDFDDYANVCLAAEVVREDHSVLVNGVGRHADHPAVAYPYLAREGLVAALAAPIRTSSGIEAALIVGYRESHEFTGDERALLEGLAQQGGIALETAHLIAAREEVNRELSRRLEATIGALASAIAAEDGYTADHSHSVVRLATAVGEEIGLPSEEIAEVQTVAELHDVGKIGVPNEILNKGSALSDEEWNVMRRHPEVGERILVGIPGLESVARAVRHEHEHFDGSGYPDRLAGDEIPLASRIVLVCDAFHAMTSDRPYRKAMTRDQAFEELARNTSTQFDPNVIHALFQVVGGVRALQCDIPFSASRIG